MHPLRLARAYSTTTCAAVADAAVHTGAATKLLLTRRQPSAPSAQVLFRAILGSLQPVTAYGCTPCIRRIPCGTTRSIALVVAGPFASNAGHALRHACSDAPLPAVIEPVRHNLRQTPSATPLPTLLRLARAILRKNLQDLQRETLHACTLCTHCSTCGK